MRWLGLLLLAHLAATCVVFDPRLLATPDPITSGDSAYHYYGVVAADALWRRDHRTTGYDPFFMAGYPAGIPFDIDARGAEWFCRLWSGIGLARAYKMFAFLALLVTPLLVYLAARTLGLRDTEALACLLLVLALWHFGRPLLGHLRWSGKFTFLLASGACVLGIAAARRALETRSLVRLAGVAALVGATWQLNALVGPLLLPALATLYVCRCRSLRRRDHAMIAAGAAFVLAMNADWLLPLARLRDARPPTQYWLQFDGWREVVALFGRTTSILLPAIVVLGLAGLFRWARRDRVAALACAIAAAAWFGVAFFGARVPALAGIDPGRCLIPFAFLLSIAAGVEFGHWLDRLRPRFGGFPAAVGFGVGAISLPFLAFAGNRVLDQQAIAARVAPAFTRLTDFLAGQTTKSARILFETPGGRHNPSPLLYGTHLQALLPLAVEREFIGGPNPAPYLAHAAIDLRNGELLQRPLSGWSDEDFARYLATYNVGWIVGHTGATRAFMDAYAGATMLGTVEEFTVYAVLQPPTWLAAGSGRVEASTNRIAVSDAAGDEIVLKYHWVPGLRSTPPLAVEPVPIAGDPIGFIRVRPNGTSHFVLELGR
jgi:hypothetical protein